MKELRTYIKEMAAQQIELKKQRKTGTLPEFPRDDWGYVSWSQIPTADRVRIKNANRAALEVQWNRDKITVALNLYHELRGSSYRHGPSSQEGEYWYKKEKEALLERLASVKTE
jgi:hypothetical protein